MSDKNHHPSGGDPSKTRASALPRLAATRQNDTNCLTVKETGEWARQGLTPEWPLSDRYDALR